MSQDNLKAILKKICDLQPSYSSENTIEMQERSRLIRSELVSELRARSSMLSPHMGEYGGDFLVGASDGIGRKTEAPWVRFCSEKMSPAPTDGYYFVIHFSRDGTACFLTVGCGSTKWENGSLTPLKQDKLLEKTQLAKRALLSEESSLGNYQDEISLGANAPLPKTFEQATVIAKKVLHNNIDSTDFDQLFVEGARYLKTIYDFQKTGFDLSQADQVELDIIEVIKPKRRKVSGSQGYGLTAPERKAVENRAMELTRNWFEDQAYQVRDTSANKPYDFLVTKNSQNIKVEVKGTTSTKPDTILMTANEVKLHSSEKGATALAIVSEIKLIKTSPPKALEGNLEVLMSWDIDQWKQTPVAYRVERT